MRNECGRDYYFGLRDIHKGLSSVPLLEMEAHQLKNIEKAVICL
jgi:hypothetical protein